MLHQARSRRIHHVRRHRADNDEVNLLQIEGMTLEQVSDRFHRQVTGSNAFGRDVAFANTSAVQDPLVGGLNHGFKVFVAQYSRRDIGSQRRNLGAATVCQ
jgi:hypothetical protein